MKPLYCTFFGFTREPFGSELSVQEILKTQEVMAVCARFDYAVRLGAISLVTGEVGSGKSTALRFAKSRLHPSEYRPLWITASSGSILELYRQLSSELEIDSASSSCAVILRLIRRQILELVDSRKLKPVLIVDDASLLRLVHRTGLEKLLYARCTMTDANEVKIACAIWSLLSHLNDRLWDRYEQEFLEIVGKRDQMEEYEKCILNLTKLDLPF